MWSVNGELVLARFDCGRGFPGPCRLQVSLFSGNMPRKVGRGRRQIEWMEM